MFIVRYKYVFIAIALLLVVGSVGVVVARGVTYGIDFTGGSLVEVNYPQGRPDMDELRTQLESLSLGSVTVQTAGETGILLRTRSVNDEERVALLGVLSQGSASTSVARFDSIGPVIGSELKRKSFWAIALVIALIVAYITFAFRHVSRPVNSWKYGLIAIVSLMHDVAVPTGFFVGIGGEVGVLFVTAILAILGFSVHDTIVVFDRIRENLKYAPKNESFAETVGKSLNQTFARSINTSLTVVLVLLSLFLLGGSSTREFALVLLVGIVAGTFSSIFLAAPLLVEVERWQRKKAK